MSTPHLLEISGLRVSFGEPGRDKEVLHGVDLTVGQGEIVGLVGESGSGKSITSLAILQLLGRTGRITGGSIKLRGRELVGLPEHKMQRIRGKDVSMIFQDPTMALNPVFTVGTQLTDVIRAHRELRGDALRAEIREMLERVGIHDPDRCVKSYPHELSGGMRQRVMIAMALVCGPQLVLADEPTTALDVTVQAQIITLLRELVRDLGISMIFITHNLDLMAELCDRAIVLYGGSVMESGSTEELFLRPRHPYTRLLLDSIPRLGDARHERLAKSEGGAAVSQSLHDGASGGCPFSRRCNEAESRCFQLAPPLTRREGREIACWLHDA